MQWFGQLPDPRLPFAFAFLSPFLADRARLALCRADVVVASNPPWPILLAARFIRWRFGCRTVLDYRDHFSECHEMPGSAPAKAVEKVIDRWLCAGADRLVVVSEPMARYYRRWHAHVDTVLNGFDPEVIGAIRAASHWRHDAGGPVRLRYMGVVTPDRVPRNMINGFAAAVQAGGLAPRDVRFEYYGDCALVEQHLRQRHPDLLPYFHFLAPVPYRTSLQLIVESDYLLFSENSSTKTLSAQGVLTTKLFEYLAAGRPIVADIAPETLAGRLLARAGGSHVVDVAAGTFEAFFRNGRFRSPPATFDPPFVQSLSRASQADEYLGILDKCCSTSEPLPK
jgi:glycosyltransferase involved in cell wall biosynthesis